MVDGRFGCLKVVSTEHFLKNHSIQQQEIVRLQNFFCRPVQGIPQPEMSIATCENETLNPPFRNGIALASLDENAKNVGWAVLHAVDVAAAAHNKVLDEVLLCEVQHREHVVVRQLGLFAIQVPKFSSLLRRNGKLIHLRKLLKSSTSASRTSTSAGFPNSP